MAKRQEAEQKVIGKIPQGCQHMYGNLFKVPFSAIRTPDPEGDSQGSYVFQNPRMNTERGQAELLDRKLSAELRESIRNRTLLNPLVCRWVRDGETLTPMVIGGDRRYRCLDYLIRRKESVVDPRSLHEVEGRYIYKMAPADQVYEFVLCQVFSCNDDLEALALAWAENKSRVNLTDGSEVAEVIKLRDSEATDHQIMEILQQDQRWLAETDRLIESLDPNTLADLLEGRIDRASAARLSSIEDEEVREQVRGIASDSAETAHRRRMANLDNRLERALERQEIAEGQRAVSDDPVERDEADEEARLAKAEALAVARQRTESRPVVNPRNVREAEARIGRRQRSARRLSNESIASGVEYLASLLDGDTARCPEGRFTAPADSLQLVMRILQDNIIGGSDDWAETLARHYAQ